MKLRMGEELGNMDNFDDDGVCFIPSFLLPELNHLL